MYNPDIDDKYVYVDELKRFVSYLAGNNSKREMHLYKVLVSLIEPTLKTKKIVNIVTANNENWLLFYKLIQQLIGKEQLAQLGLKELLDQTKTSETLYLKTCAINDTHELTTSDINSIKDKTPYLNHNSVLQTVDKKFTFDGLFIQYTQEPIIHPLVQMIYVSNKKLSAIDLEYVMRALRSPAAIDLFRTYIKENY